MGKKGRKSIKKKFRSSLIPTVVFLILCITCYAANRILAYDLYDDLLSIIPGTDVETRKDTYIKAITLAPEKDEAYLELISLYWEDGVFTKTESEEFLSLYNRCCRRMNRRSETYAQIHYEAGLLYVNGYEDTAQTRLRLGFPFLKTANDYMDTNHEFYEMVRGYCLLGDYCQTYLWEAAASAQEVSKQEMEMLLQEISDALISLSLNQKSEALYNRLSFIEVACALLYNQRNTLAKTVELSTVENLLDSIYGSLPDADTLQKEQSRTMVETFLANEDTFRRMIQMAYEREGNS